MGKYYDAPIPTPKSGALHSSDQTNIQSQSWNDAPSKEHVFPEAYDDGPEAGD